MSKLITLCCLLVFCWAAINIPRTNGLEEVSPEPLNVSQDVLDLVENRTIELQERWKGFNDVCDRRSSFAAALFFSVRKIKNAIEQNQFNNGSAVAELLIGLIDRYEHAIDNFRTERNTFVPKPWRKALKFLFSNESTGLQDVFLGTNALINYDLAFVLNRTKFCCTEDNFEDFKRFRDLVADIQVRIANELCLRYDPSACLVTQFTLEVVNPTQLHMIHRWFNIAWNEAEKFAAVTSNEEETALIRDYAHQASLQANDFIEIADDDFDRDGFCKAHLSIIVIDNTAE